MRTQTKSFDWIIRGGKVIDGTGSGPVCADIGVGGERVEAVGDLSRAEAGKIIDAAGGYVCPGFIDAHSHSDAFLLVEPSAASKIYQGVTTEIIGNCGASAAPIENLAQLPFDWQQLPYPQKWQSMAEYLALLKQGRPTLNIIPLVGHNRLRIAVMGYAARPPTADEMKRMERLLEKSLAEGAWGLSTGLIYRPGKFAAAEEITRLAGIVAQRNGIYTSHMRSEKSKVREAVAETLAVARLTGVRTQISHLKTAGAPNWRLLDEVLAMLAQARAAGLAVAADRYPYTFSGTDLDVILPDWITAGSRENILRQMRAAGSRRRLLQDLGRNRPDNYWRDIIIATSREANWRGRPVSVIAQELRLEPAEAALKILVRDELQTQAFFAGMSEANMWKILSQPFVMIGSDAAFRPARELFAHDHPHPRAYGSFTKFLRAALDGKTVALGEAVRKMTTLPADHFGIKGRGRLQAGHLADVIVFDPAVVRDLATYENPRRFSAGLRLVMVNGKVVLENNKLTGQRPGRILTP